ncbi:SDR family oxidoreductase [Prodigiosinella aquatilis]|nr:SDR family oxidoreductase [Prodigiosinella sp. LS101]WJV55268.1 SDR family oxidoreductase [Prodigiosinella sp. LS101]WJV59629.1 SDR family oxidoreductase [Pectobacteriaceae bacterium C111]
MFKILITGSTGFIGGSFMAYALEKYGAENILTIARETQDKSALIRVRENLKNFHVSDDLLEKLSDDNIINGDLLNPEHFLNDERLNVVTHVVNCAAVASFGNNPRIWAVNVEGTFKLAQKMAEVEVLQKFVHVGTAMACLPEKGAFVTERLSSSSHGQHIVPYTRSKAEIEERIIKYLPGLPLIIARPSIVVGHSKYGCEPSSSIFWVFSMVIKLSKYMCSLQDKVDIIPVDYCAEGLDLLMNFGDINDPIYHISAGEKGAVTFSEIDASFAEAQGTVSISKNYEQVEFDYFLKNQSNFRIIFGDCNEKLMLKSIYLYGEFSKLNVVFSNEKIVALGLKESARFTTYIDKCVKTTQGKNIMEMMMCDFK